MKRLLIVRHGETEWNAVRRLQGQTDIALSDRGREQARALRPLIAAQRPDLVVSSDLRRAAETAALLGHADARLTPDLREQCLGDWSGRDIADLQADAAQDYADWRAGRFTPPDAEGWDSFRDRVAGAMQDAAAQAGHTALVVCHGGVIRAALQALVGLPPSRVVPVAPASLTILLMDPNGARIEAMNIAPGALRLDAPD
ncbi:histidine phosphatase family protein [Paracoccus laeviglucosivorans]|uniref:Probable phosphoglycerate mutase n=1 Tax=Paracoccus laeviglucosivorans TaxID=1197861 RepID=A0A521BAC2_9RHOB|nr:histidine phosphatase family protein [Paracoccus laeviglucosivorans]SMO44013.1 probable phosphoglycerate mutase [Paracoccus laeviglucosivorans]